MGNVIAVHEAHSLQDLIHELDGFALQQVLLRSNEVKQFPPTNTEMSIKQKN